MTLVGEKKAASLKPERLNAEQVTQRTMGTKSVPGATTFDSSNPLGLSKGDTIHVYPSDYGQSGKSTGTLIGLSTNEVVIQNDKGLYLHFPRWNFTLKRSPSSNSTPPTKNWTGKTEVKEVSKI
ncbi:hypothetical protein NX059_005189 [Plenodomus lindquistii]|nr:hypothetical protein NX059_005189 [Plenodomus lindquistii]